MPSKALNDPVKQLLNKALDEIQSELNELKKELEIIKQREKEKAAL